MELPPRFVLEHDEAGTRGANWLRRYNPRGERSVEIFSAYRGYPQVPVDNEHMREVLQAAPLLVFDEAGEVSDTDAVRGMSLALGNVGNNQICNFETGVGAPVFHLTRLCAESIAGRPVIRAEGWFHDIDKQPTKYFNGIFIDATPDDVNARVEELYLQTSTEAEMSEYKPLFDQLLKSIKWS